MDTRIETFSEIEP